MANLYGFGRLAWNPKLSADKIADEWARLTFGNDPVVVQTISNMQLNSWRTYESYTGPLGAANTDQHHRQPLRPGIESSEENGWGQWHRADKKGIGMDRTVATGTGFVGQYPPAVQKVYESLATRPTNSSYSSTTFRTPTCFTRERQSYSTSTTRITRAQMQAATMSTSGNRSKATSTRTLSRHSRAPRIPGRTCDRVARRDLQLDLSPLWCSG